MLTSPRLLFVYTVLFIVAGCDSIPSQIAGRPAEDSEEAARQHLDQEFVKWIGGKESEAKAFTQPFTPEPPIAYTVRSVVPDQVDFLAFKDGGNRPANWKEWPAYGINVSVEWATESNEPLVIVVRYTLSWHAVKRRWYAKQKY